MTATLKLFDEHFVGINHERDDVTAGPLAFMTPYEDNTAGRKRRESVRQWLYGYYYNPNTKKDESKRETKIVKNIPSTEFRVVDFADRWSTSNKLARIYDPNGFEVEISIANLIDLMLTTTVDRGAIKTECVWVREGANNRLMRTDDPLVEQARENMTPQGKPKRVRLDHEIGDIIENSYGQYLYLGYFDVNYVVASGEVKDDAEYRAQHDRIMGSNTSWLWGSRFEPRNMIGKDSGADVSIGKRHVYREYDEDPRYRHRDYLLIRKKKMTAQRVVNSAAELVPEITPQSYFRCEETQYYDATRTLLGERSKHYYDYGRRLGQDVWETSVVRLDTSEPIDVKRIQADLRDSW